MSWGFSLSKNLTRVNFGAMNYIFPIFSQKETLSHKQHTKNIIGTLCHSCVSDLGPRTSDLDEILVSQRLRNCVGPFLKPFYFGVSMHFAIFPLVSKKSGVLPFLEKTRGLGFFSKTWQLCLYISLLVFFVLATTDEPRHTSTNWVTKTCHKAIGPNGYCAMLALLLGRDKTCGTL